MMKLNRLAIVLAAFAVVAFVFSAPAEASFITVTTADTGGEDTYTYNQAPDTNYGADVYFTANKDKTDYGPKVGFVKFNVSGVDLAAVTNVTFRVFVDSTSSTGSFDLFEVADTWAEGTLTYTNMLSTGLFDYGSPGTALAGGWVWAATPGHWIDYEGEEDEISSPELTAYIKAQSDGVVSLALRSTWAGGNGLRFHSKENAATNPPELVFELDEGPPIPEPASLSLLGLAMLALKRRRS